MSVQTPVLPPASAELEMLEPVSTGLATGHAATVVTTAKSAEGNAAVRSQAVELVRETVELAERAQAAGRNHVELRLPNGGDSDLRVHLSWHDGVVHTKFLTPDADLRQALSREWERATPQLAEKGLKFGEASFENRGQSDQSAAQNASNFDQQRHPSRGQSRNNPDHAAEFTLQPSATNTTAPVRRSANGAATAVAAPTNSTITERRSLRAWA
jgi:hypothetical protein